jgi:hypothetical protein
MLLHAIVTGARNGNGTSQFIPFRCRQGFSGHREEHMIFPPGMAGDKIDDESRRLQQFTNRRTVKPSLFDVLHNPQKLAKCAPETPVFLSHDLGRSGVMPFDKREEVGFLPLVMEPDGRINKPDGIGNLAECIRGEPVEAN